MYSDKMRDVSQEMFKVDALVNTCISKEKII